MLSVRPAGVQCDQLDRALRGEALPNLKTLPTNCEHAWGPHGHVAPDIDTSATR